MSGMVKPIEPESYLSGTGDLVSPSPTFLYEITIDRIFPKESRMESVKTRYISSQIPLHFKKTYRVQKKKDYLRTISIYWIGAPQEYINQNNFQKYEYRKNKARSKHS